MDILGTSVAKNGIVVEDEDIGDILSPANLREEWCRKNEPELIKRIEEETDKDKQYELEEELDNLWYENRCEFVGDYLEQITEDCWSILDKQNSVEV